MWDDFTPEDLIERVKEGGAMGWAIAGGVAGIVIMFGAYRWLTGWATARSGNVSIPTIGSRPRRLAGVPEEAPEDARTPPAMEVLRHGEIAEAAETEEPEVVEEAPEVAAEAEAIVEEAESGDDAAEEEAAIVTAGADCGVAVEQVHQGTDDSGEYVVIANGGSAPVGLEGWRLTDEGEKHEYSFGAVILESGSSLRVHMWRGEDSESDLYVGRRNRWWNNTGDTAYLYDSEGTLVHSLTTEPVADD